MSFSQNLGLHKCFHESWLEIAPGGRDEAHHGCNQEQNYLTVLEPFNCGPGVAMTRVPMFAQNNEPTRFRGQRLHTSHLLVSEGIEQLISVETIECVEHIC